MKVYKFNSVFDHVEITLHELFDNNPNFDNTLFVLGYNVLKELGFLRQLYKGYKIIIYQLEQLHDKSYWANKHSYKLLHDADEVWDYDKSNIEWMYKNYNIKAHFIPLLYTNNLKHMQSVDIINPDIDVLFYGYTQERRARMIFNLQQKMAGKFKIFNMYGIWGSELDEYISRSKVIINIHSENIAKQEQVRMYYPVINGRCVLSEVSSNNYMGDSIIQVPYERMVDATMKIIENGTWKTMALKSSDTYKKISDDYKNTLKIK